MAKSSSDVGGTIVTAGVILVGGYVGLSLFSRLTQANAASLQAQNQSFLQKLLNSLSGGKSSGSGGGAGGAGAGKSSIPGLSALSQAIADGNAILAQYNPFSSDTNALIPSQSISSAWDVLGNDFGFSPGAFDPLSTNDDTSSAGEIAAPVSSTWDVALDPSVFNGDGLDPYLNDDGLSDDFSDDF